MTATKRTNTRSPVQASRSKIPMLAIGLVAVAAALVVSVMFAGGEQLGGAEFGTPEIAGTSLPAALNSNPLDATEDPAYGLPMPEVTGQDFTGHPVVIKRDGTPRALLFVSHSCPHCQAEIPEVQTWLNAGGGVDGVELITVSTAANSAAGNWPPSAWLERESWQASVIADDADSSAFVACGGQAIPYWVFVDSAGNVSRRNVGRMQLADIEAAMREIAS